MEALYQHSGQRSRYTRTLADPGGENVVVMLKSCFPNSHLKGNPDDPPAPGEGLIVSNAEYIYNELLQYFATRPGPENHHRFHNGAVEHITDQGGDTQFFPPNGDDHPNKEGNQKATSEFVPMLNVFYNRWKASLPAQPPLEDMNTISSSEGTLKDTGNRSSTGLCP